MCLSVICISLEKYLFRSSANFSIVFLGGGGLLSCMSALSTLKVELFLVTSFANIFSESVVFWFCLWFPLLCKSF